MPAKTKKHYLLLAVFFLVTYAYFFQGGGWNQNSRFCLTRAIIDQHSFIIDRYREDSQDPYFEFVNTADVAYYDGHYYSNKSPGMSFAAVGPFAVADYILQYVFPEDIEKRVLFSAYVSTLFVVVPSAVLLCLLLLHVFEHFFGFNSARSLLLTLCFGLGTLIFSYSTTFFSHVPAAFFAFLSFVLAMHIKHGAAGRKKSMALLAGFSSATAVLIEPSSVFILGCVVVYMLSCKQGRRLVPLFILGCIPPALLQCTYNTVCFGGPFASSYNYAVGPVMWKVDGRLFGIPKPRVLLELLVMPYRGLFVTSPIYLMVLPGMVLFFKERRWLSEALLCTATAIIFFLFMASFYGWPAGSTVGPRYMVPGFPFGFMLTVFALKKFPKTFTAVALVSFFINFSITVVGNEIPITVKNPLGVVFSNLAQGKVSINPLPFMNFTAFPNLYDLGDPRHWSPNFNSFNLGELFFPHHIASIIPLLIFWAVWGYLWKCGNRAGKG